MTKRTGNIRGRREKQKHNPQYAKERGKHLAKKMLRKKKRAERAKHKFIPSPPVEKPKEPTKVKDPTEGFF